MSESIDGEIYRSKVNIIRKFEVQCEFHIEPITEIHHPYPYDSDDEREFYPPSMWKSTAKFFMEDKLSSDIKIPQTQIVKFRNHILFKD